MNQLQKIDLERAYWQRERLKLPHPLRQLFWECTLRCNLACRHCGRWITTSSVSLPIFSTQRTIKISFYKYGININQTLCLGC